MPRKKVLLLVTLSETGGAQKVVFHLAAGLGEKFDITVACAPGGELVDWLKRVPDIKVIELGCLKRNISPIHDLICLFKLYRLFGECRYEIVHCHSSKAGVLGRLAARLAGVRQIYFTVHGWGIDERQPLPVRLCYTLAERLAGAVSTGVICVSRHDREKGLALGLVAPEKMAVIYNGVPDMWQHDDIGRDRGSLRTELGLGREDILIGTVMRLAPPKKPVMFLEAAAGLLKKFDQGGGSARKKSLCFVVIGDGPLRSECERYIHDHNLGGHVFLLGTREDAPRLVAGLDVFTLFSDHEGLPLTIIEAMLAGVPVVAGNVGGVGELVIHGETGYLVDRSGPDRAVAFIEELVVNPELRTSLGKSGRRRVLEKFCLEEMLQRYNDIYMEVKKSAGDSF